MKIIDLVEKGIWKQSGYVAPEFMGAVKMDANENPFSIQEPLRKKLLEEMGRVAFNRYPAAGAPELRERFAKYYGVKKDMIMLGNGSDELIQILCLALKGKIKGVLVPVPTFSMYKIIAINTGNKVVEVPLDKKFDLDVDAILDRIKSDFPALIFLSYPNSPTGNLFNRNRIEAVIKKTPGLVVIDEAYASFSGRTLLPLLKKYDNVIFLNTLSKLGMASMRLGFLIGSRDIIAQLDKVRLPYNVNSLSQTAAGFFLDYQDEFSLQVDEIVARREELYLGLKGIAGIRPYPSKANFIFFSCSFDSNRIYNSLVAEGVIVKNLNMPPLMSNCMRVTVGSKDENEAFLKALKKVTEKQGA
ncbi:MAG: histidinol-phosphate transaminase [Deltaproteobacteria bacterium]|nr:histidinol-phosphate transaminase [Deltaproteobacteria bacterium]